MGNNIELKTINELLGMNFFIPSYQRGYRWSSQQVTDLLEDIQDFIENKKSDGFYCIQPLVVRELKEDTFTKIKDEAKTLEEVKNLLKGRWEVIDGQQRLTTIYILLACLGENNPYSIEYETRSSSKTFLKQIQNCKCSFDNENTACSVNCIVKNSEEKICTGFENINIDYFHMIQAKCTIDKWFKNKSAEEKMKFKSSLLNNVNFIWYESVDEDPIKVFTRLNIGKISLTNAELIKALFLNSSNFQESDFQKIRLKQQEIASEWDHIEYTLQNDEFWLFIHDTTYSNPTRIDFIFDLIYEQNRLALTNFEENKIGKDKYRTFRYFYEYFKSNKNKINEDFIEECWKKVKTVFQTFEEWYNDLELYHYVGYLVDQGTTIYSLLKCWNESINKKAFIKNKDEKRKGLVEQIKNKINDCNKLSTQYEIDKPDNKGKYPAKTTCKPLLLLHNIQTVINQNKNYKEKDSYQLGVFYKFPFHLYKLESWDVEHIDSNTENDMTDKESQNEYLLNIYNAVSTENQTSISDFIKDSNANNFEELKNLISVSTENQLSNEEKNKVWNFTLLDSNTNRSYGNSIFSAKRRIVIGKDKGKLIPIPKIGKKDGNPIPIMDEEKDALSSFIPPVTKQIFLKYYSSASSSPNIWDRSDAEAYKQNIYNTLQEFLKPNEGENNNEQ